MAPALTYSTHHLAGSHQTEYSRTQTDPAGHLAKDRSGARSVASLAPITVQTNLFSQPTLADRVPTRTGLLPDVSAVP